MIIFLIGGWKCSWPDLASFLGAVREHEREEGTTRYCGYVIRSLELTVVIFSKLSLSA